MDEHPQSIRDHDLLIRLDQKVDGVSLDIKELKENLADRVAKLEMNKSTFAVTDDHEKRLRAIEDIKIPAIKNRIAYWSGGLAVLALGLGALIAFLSRH